MLSPSDTAIVFLLALLLFGPEQLPRIARQLGEAMRHIQTTTHSFMNEMERAARADDAASQHTHYSRDGREIEPSGFEAEDSSPAAVEAPDAATPSTTTPQTPPAAPPA